MPLHDINAANMFVDDTYRDSSASPSLGSSYPQYLPKETDKEEKNSDQSNIQNETESLSHLFTPEQRAYMELEPKEHTEEEFNNFIEEMEALYPRD